MQIHNLTHNLHHNTIFSASDHAFSGHSRPDGHRTICLFPRPSASAFQASSMPSATMRLRKNEYFFICFLNNRTSTPSASKAAFTSFQMSQKHWANVYQNLCQNRREPTSQMKGLRGRFAVSRLQGFFLLPHA